MQNKSIKILKGYFSFRVLILEQIIPNIYWDLLHKNNDYGGVKLINLQSQYKNIEIPAKLLQEGSGCVELGMLM